MTHLSGFRALSFLCLLPLLIACDVNPVSKTAMLETEIAVQKTEIEALKIEVEAIKERFQTLQNKVWLLEIYKDQHLSATFDPAGDDGFQRLDTDVGTFAISIKDVKPNADGIKVRIEVGNLTTATISGGTFKLKWGPRMAKTENQDIAKNYDEWQKLLVEKEHKFVEDLRPGSWNDVTVSLPGISSEKFGYLEIKMETSQIKLLIPRK